MVHDLFNENGDCKHYTFFRKSTLPHNACCRNFINKEYPNYTQFLDRDFTKKLKSNFYGAFAELRCVYWLKKHENLELLKRKSTGPDFIFHINEQQMNFESTSISAGNSKILHSENTGACFTPIVDAVRERIRSAIRTKCEQVDNTKETSNYFRWVKKDIIKPDEPFVLVIDISQITQNNQSVCLTIPAIYIGAVLPLGDFAIDYNLETRKLEGGYCKYKDSLTKDNGSPVKTDIFLDEQFSHISAVIISRTCVNEGKLYTSYMLIHNSLAKNTIPYNLFKVNYEIATEEVGEKRYRSTDLKGNQIGI